MSLPVHKIIPSKLPNSGLPVSLNPNSQEADYIAGDLGVEKLLELQIDITAYPWNSGGVRIKGNFAGVVEQECVITLSPLENAVSGSFERLFMPSSRRVESRNEIVDGELLLDPEAEEGPDQLEQDLLDLWEVALEEIVLAVDLFPRAPDASISDGDDANQTVDIIETHKPFQNLEALITEKKLKN